MEVGKGVSWWWLRRGGGGGHGGGQRGVTVVARRVQALAVVAAEVAGEG